MYGYVRPVKSELKVREYDMYKSLYCGLCETLRRRYGLAARFTVSYDMTFMAMLLSSQGEQCRRRCPVHPFRSRNCVRCDTALEKAADYSVILAARKLLDDRNDKHFPQNLAASAGYMILRGACRRAEQYRPGFSDNAEKCMAELRELEKEKCDSLDRPADCFGRMLSFAAQEETDGEQRRILSELLYHVGRFVYIADAVDDYADDLLSSSYNPIRYRFGEMSSITEPVQSELRGTLNLSQNRACRAMELRKKDIWQPILENILILGLPATSELVISGRWQKKNNRSKQNE